MSGRLDGKIVLITGAGSGVLPPALTEDISQTCGIQIANGPDMNPASLL